VPWQEAAFKLVVFELVSIGIPLLVLRLINKLLCPKLWDLEGWGIGASYGNLRNLRSIPTHGSAKLLGDLYTPLDRDVDCARVRPTIAVGDGVVE
jgi:hypothetical protein